MHLLGIMDSTDEEKSSRARATFVCRCAGGAVVFTNSTGYAVANANFTLPGFYNVSATFPGNTTTNPTLNPTAAFAGCAQRVASLRPIAWTASFNICEC